MRVSPQAAPSRLEILMYHSISNEPGPTSIAPEVFETQLRLLRHNGYACVSLKDVAAWGRGARILPDRSFVLTFDDGFADFASTAFPIMQAQGFSGTVFLPTARMGGSESWYGANRKARPLMSWQEVLDLSAAGIEFGGHSETHADLTRLAPTELEREVRGSQDTLAERLGSRPTTFAPPYGSSDARVLREIARWAEVSVGTRLDHACPGDDLVDLPRLEMFYFRTPAIWDLYLKRRGDAYLKLRQLARAVRARLH